MNKQLEQGLTTSQENFRIFLKNELSRRCKKNPAYSLRSFARLIGISHTALSQILAKKRPLTVKTQKQIADVLSLSPEQLVSFQIPKHIVFEEQFKPAVIDDFEIYSDWIHDAILELTQLKFFKGDLKWIANVLEVSTHQVSAAVDRLKRAKLLDIDSKGKWHDLSADNTTSHLEEGFTHAAFKKYQKDILEKSIAALESLPREERDHSSLMLKFSKKNMKEAKKLIKEFRARFSVEAKTQSSRDDVFVLNISFYPISKNSKENL